MASLIETSALSGLLPIETGPLTLTEAALGPVTSIAPLAGKARALATALKPLGLRFPASGEWHGSGAAELFWAGHASAFLTGVIAPDALAGAAATTDQSDAWAAMDLTGPGGEAVMARLCPVDLRLVAFPVGRVARAPLGHMQMILIRRAENSLRIMVFRSMAKTAVHELSVAMRGVAARG